MKVVNFVIAKVEVVFIWFVESTVNFEDIFEENVINVDWWIEDVITFEVVNNVWVEVWVDFNLLVKGEMNVGAKVLIKYVDM